VSIRRSERAFWRRLALAAPLALALLAGHAQAEPTPQDKDAARKLVFEGRDLKKDGRTREALEKLRAAHAIMNVPTTGIEVAQALADLGLLVEARDAMLDVSRMPAKPGEPVPYGQARDEARHAVDDLGARIPSVRFTVTGAPSATVVLDGTAIDPSVLALPHKLNPGEHGVVATAAGFAEQKIKVELAERDAKSVIIAMQRSEAGAPVAAPAPPAPAAPPAMPDVDVKKQPSPSRNALVYGGFGAAIVGVVVGSVTGVMSLAKTSSVKDRCAGDRCPESLHDDLASARTFATISDVAFVVAALGGAAGVIGLVVAPKDSRRSAAHLVVGPSAIGIAGTL
jgi:hypothetical protein